MKFTLLGTGAVGGVPLYGCDCPACQRARTVQSFIRRPSSALIEHGHTRIALDAGPPDFGARFPSGSLDAVLLTHYHMDHVAGLFEIRWGKGASLAVHGPIDEHGCDDLHIHHGILDFSATLEAFQSFFINDIRITALPLIHSRPTLGYFLEADGTRIAYLTDTVDLPAATLAFLQTHRPDLMVLDCSHPPSDTPRRNHNDLNLALQLHQRIAPPETWLTHISHDLDAWLIEHPNPLPQGVFVGRDGQYWRGLI
ncbi:MAG TPA: phosphonate metabolism protein PhnP [bacterium]|nr:phosphonate metabolism protein PhnP [bacterium]